MYKGVKVESKDEKSGDSSSGHSDSADEYFNQ